MITPEQIAEFIIQKAKDYGTHPNRIELSVDVGIDGGTLGVWVWRTEFREANCIESFKISNAYPYAGATTKED